MEMRILRIITRLNIGGPALQAISLTKELSLKGHNCTLFTGFSSDDEGYELEKEAFYIIPHRTYWFRALQREINLRKDFWMFKVIRNELKHGNYDILHTHMSKAGFLGRLAALSIPKKNRLKIVHTFHGHTFHSYFGWLKSFAFRRIEIFLAKRSDVIIAISKGQREELIDYGIPSHKIKIIPLGFDLSEFLKIRKFEYDKDKILRIGFVGRLAPIKNLELFVEVVEKLYEHFAIEIVIAGDGSKEEKEKLLPLRGLIIEQHWFERKEMSDFYRMVDMVICTSKNEGTPVGLIEAMAAGKLVMSTPVGGVKDLIGRGARGIYIYEDMLNLTINRLKILLEDNAYKDLIRDAREYVKKNHKLENLVNSIESLYLDLMNEKG